jgi:hypothetical protein
MTIWGMKCLDPKSDSQNSNFCRPPLPLNTLTLNGCYFQKILGHNFRKIRILIQKKKRNTAVLNSPLPLDNPVV